MNHEPTLTSAKPHPVRIAVISFLALTLELALIRFIPSEIKAISYFTNLLLFSAFFGLGLGCILWKRKLPPYVMVVGLLLIFAYMLISRGITIYDTHGELHYWLQQDDQRFKPFLQMPLIVAAFAAFLVGAIPFIALGWNLAREMQQHERLLAYSYDLLGSLLGTILFAVVSCLGCPPWILIAATALVWGAVFCTGLKLRIAHFAAGLLFFYFVVQPYSWCWSPYYFVQYNVDPSRITVWVNSSFHQEAIDFNTSDPAAQQTVQQMVQKFDMPYKLYKRFHNGQGPQKVLILGAGSGNDVNIALLNGVPDVTAVEIDPQIARIGREFNRMQPYQNPAVRLVIDDGRHFLWTTNDRFDLVIFGTLDSQTLLAGQTNLRLDNYIYTTQCFDEVRNVLKPDGMFAAYYSVFKEWFFQRIYSTVAAAFPGKVRLYGAGDNYLFNTVLVAAPNIAGFNSDAEQERRLNNAVPSTDNWPYIYLEYPTISSLYLELFALIGAMIVLVFVVLRKVEKSSGWHLDFFFLGVGFSLLESAAIARLALAFGTTWVVSAVVFASVLLTVFLANYVCERFPRIPTAWGWAGLMAAVAVNFFFPVEVLLSFSFPLRLLFAAVLIGTPVFFAGICFSSLFKREPEVGLAFGMNMIGAMAGGSIEYLSMLIGMKFIWLILLDVYFAALVSNRIKARFAT